METRAIPKISWMHVTTGKTTSQEAVGVFDGAALPGCVRIAEVRFQFQDGFQPLILMEFPAVAYEEVRV